MPEEKKKLCPRWVDQCVILQCCEDEKYYTLKIYVLLLLYLIKHILSQMHCKNSKKQSPKYGKGNKF